MTSTYRIGQKPVENEIIDAVLAKDINAIEPQLTRHGYNTKVLAELLDTKPAEIRSFLHGNLTPTRSQEIQNSLLTIAFRSDFLFAYNVVPERCLQVVCKKCGFIRN